MEKLRYAIRLNETIEKKLMDEGMENKMCGEAGGLPLIKKI
jgi:hypothetical protein